MKKNIITLLLIFESVLHAETWQPEHTFPDLYEQLVFNGGEYLCLASDAKYGPFLQQRDVAKSSDLIQWNIYTNSSLNLTALEGGEYEYLAVDDDDTTFTISMISTTGTEPNKYLAIVYRSWVPSGNISDKTLLSVISTNGIDWSNASYVTSDGPDEDFASLQLENKFLLAVRSLGWPFGIVNWRATIHEYSDELNSWEMSQDLLISPYEGSCDLFSDASNVFLSYKENYTDPITNTVIFSSGGLSWTILRQSENTFVSGAAAHNGQIISPSYAYSTGQGWINRDLGNIENLIFNGNRLAGNSSDSLLYSDNFGQTWNETFVGEISSASIIEADQKYIALISTSTNSSIYTLDAYPSRATVTEIQGFGTTPAGLNFQSTSNGLYQLECTTSLINPEWKAYGLPEVGTGGKITADPSGNLISNMFFRVRAINN